MSETYAPPVTQVELERELLDLDELAQQLIGEAREAERTAARAKRDYELSLARAQISIRAETQGKGEKYTVDEKNALALTKPEVEAAFSAMLFADAEISGFRSVMKLVSTRSDLLRSINSNLRPHVSR